MEEKKKQTEPEACKVAKKCTIQNVPCILILLILRY